MRRCSIFAIARCARSFGLSDCDRYRTRTTAADLAVACEHDARTPVAAGTDHPHAIPAARDGKFVSRKTGIIRRSLGRCREGKAKTPSANLSPKTLEDRVYACSLSLFLFAALYVTNRSTSSCIKTSRTS